MASTVDDVSSMEELALRLSQKFPESEPEKVRVLVAQTRHQYDESRIRAFIPVLVEHEVADALRAERRSPAEEPARA